MIKVIDLRSEFYYDSFIETHATPDESPIIAKSFTELLELVRFLFSKLW